MAASTTDARQEAAEGVGIGAAFAVGTPLLALLAVAIFDTSASARICLFAIAATIASFGLGGALISLGDYHAKPALGDFGVATILGGLGGVSIALTALDVLGSTVASIVTVLGFLLLLVAVIGAGIGAAKWLAEPRQGSSQPPSRAAPSSSAPSRRERLAIALSVLQTIGTFVGLFLQK